MEPQISEFSYGYSVVEEFVDYYNNSITTAPIFPSLRQEGVFGGYDVNINRMLGSRGFPLFLQFKLSHKLFLTRAKEYSRTTLNAPYYRFYLTPNSKSRQHNMLVDLDHFGNEVYYVAPYFITQEDLNFYYSNKEVLNKSFFVKPRDIRKIRGNVKHHISTSEDSNFFYKFSEEPVRENKVLSKEVIMNLNRKLEFGLSLSENISKSNSDLKKIISEESNIFTNDFLNSSLKDETGISTLVNLTRFFLGAEVLLITEN